MNDESETLLQDAVLEDLSSAVHYIDWVAALCDPWLGDAPLEIGSGTGDYAQRWRRPGRLVTVSEAEPGRVAGLSERYAGTTDVVARHLEAPVNERGEFSAVVALNVLEHIEDDREALRSFAGLVRPGGYVVILVPAFPFAMSDFDRTIGHHRRYRAAGLRAVFTAAALEPVQVGYVNAVGLLGWLVLVKMLGGRPRDGRALRLFDGRVVPIVRRLEARRSPPWGQSVLAVGRVPLG